MLARKVKCPNCSDYRTEKGSIRKCYSCNISGCVKCIQSVCCDCSESMCRSCNGGDNLCGCYGNCSSCGTNVDRGSNGWPCRGCKKWYCSSNCRNVSSKCKLCKDD